MLKNEGCARAGTQKRKGSGQANGFKWTSDLKVSLNQIILKVLKRKFR